MNSMIFDMDGLMFDTELIAINAWVYVGSMVGIDGLGQMAYKMIGLNERVSQELWRSFLGEKYNEELFQKYRHEYYSEYYSDFYSKSSIPIKKGLYELLDYLKKNGYKTAVASSTRRSVVEKNLIQTDTLKYFDAVICGDMIERSKPEPDIYLEACKLLGDSPDHCYALEDSKNGLLAAYRAGCKVIMIPDLWQPDEEINRILTARFNDLSEVITFLEHRS